MEMTGGEKLILVMLSEIHEKLGIEGDIDPKFVKNAIGRDQARGLRWQYDEFFAGTRNDDPPIVNEVAEILTMWRIVEQTYAHLSAEDKQKIKDAVPIHQVAFYGFDGNNETEHMSVAQFLVYDLGRFGELKGRDLNSHRQTLPHYLGMLAEYKRVSEAGGYAPPTVEQLTRIFNAGYH